MAAFRYVSPSKLGAANTRGVFQYLLEHRGKIARRRSDDLQDLGGRGLLLKRFFKIARLGLHLFEQARVFDRDDGLVGEGPEKRYLLICKRINFDTPKLDCSDRHSLTQQWNTRCRPVSKSSRERASLGKFVSLCLEVNYMNRLPIDDGAARNASTRAWEAKAALVRDRTPVGGET